MTKEMKKIVLSIIVALIAILGYSKKENHGYESENVGIDFDTDELNFGFHYIF